MSAKQSRRQELSEYAETGRLRDDVSGRLSTEAADLLVDVVMRYCAPRQPPIWHRLAKDAEKPQ